MLRGLWRCSYQFNCVRLDPYKHRTHDFPCPGTLNANRYDTVAVNFFGQIEIESVCYTKGSWTGLSLPKYYMDRSEAEVHIMYWGWQTGSLTAIWSKVSCTICYIIHNLPKLLQSVSEHHWMHNMDILNTNTKTITKMRDTHRKMEIYISPLKFIFKLTCPLRTINQEPKYTNTWRRTRDNKLKLRANLMVSFVC